ncbi:MAG: DUF402 domain-containing protein [Acidimicrobiia bacterium]
MPEGTHWGWYVNLQEPMKRTDRDFRSIDLMLDILVDLDRTWRWKDDDEFEALIEARLYDESIVNAVRSDAKKVITRIEENERPLYESWPAWVPEPDWSLPVLPPGWEEVD